MSRRFLAKLWLSSAPLALPWPRKRLSTRDPCRTWALASTFWGIILRVQWEKYQYELKHIYKSASFLGASFEGFRTPSPNRSLSDWNCFSINMAERVLERTATACEKTTNQRRHKHQLLLLTHRVSWTFISLHFPLCSSAFRSFILYFLIIFLLPFADPFFNLLSPPWPLTPDPWPPLPWWNGRFLYFLAPNRGARVARNWTRNVRFWPSFWQLFRRLIHKRAIHFLDITFG